MACLTILLFILFIFLPADAFAWGVGVHLTVGSHLLSQAEFLPAYLHSLLTCYPHDFLYGCISADITLGKKYTHYLQHCHSWRMGRRILDAARTDAQKACAYGYLVHLAADTVAHSYYVPYKITRTFNTVLLKHTYWEVRFEAVVKPAIWKLARKLSQRDFQANDELLRSVLSDTIFSFETNKRLFNSMMLVNRLRQWQRLIQSMNQSSKWSLEEEDQAEYLDLAREIAESILHDLDRSPFWQGDPTGERALNAARMIRKNLNLLWIDGKLPAREAAIILQDLKPRFRESMVCPDQLLELLSSE